MRFIFSFLIFASLLLTQSVYAATPTPTPFPIPTPNPCSLDISDPANKITQDEYIKQYGPCPAGLNEFEGIVANIISVIVGLGFIAMLVMMLMAGIKYLTSGGEPKAIQSAHHTLAWALLGLVFMAIAWVALQLIAAFTGLPLTVFNIKILCTDPNSALQFCTP